MLASLRYNVVPSAPPSWIDPCYRVCRQCDCVCAEGEPRCLLSRVPHGPIDRDMGAAAVKRGLAV